jgi:drug/metabolite transporter (DMT)-like permease
MRSSSGTLLCLGSATAFGAMAVFGKLAYAEGATVGTLLAARFTLAAGLFWIVVGISGPRRIGRRDMLLALALGAAGYACQAGAYFAALARIDASLLSLLVYAFPAIVTVAAIALGRERADRRRLAALAFSSTGLLLVLAGAGTGALDPLGAALGVAAALVYSAYILAGEPVAARVGAPLLAALVCTGAAVTLTAGAAALGELRPAAVTPAGWGWLACLAAVSTVGAIGLFFAALRRLGPTSTAILSTAEPLVTVVLALLVFGEALGTVQALGGMLILGAVLALHLRPRGALRVRTA